VAEELLDGANVIVGFQKVRGKAVSQRGIALAEDVGTNPFWNSRRLGCGAPISAGWRTSWKWT
jgi:hypothetical protein